MGIEGGSIDGRAGYQDDAHHLDRQAGAATKHIIL
jgi:hypothetical protein